MQIADKSVVAIDYKLTDENNQVIDSSDENDPLYYLHGAQNIVPGLENALVGKSVGDNVQATVTAADGYGERDDRLLQTVPKSDLQAAGEFGIGTQFQVSTNAGPMIVTVVKIDDESVTLDGNHPLAGKTLNFDVTVREVREATEEEIDHGHVHGPGGAHH